MSSTNRFNQPIRGDFTQTEFGPPTDRAVLIRAHQAAAEFFREHLHSKTGTPPRSYIHNRGLSHVLRSPRWEIGYATPAWTGLTDHLRRTGFDDEELVASGLSLNTRRRTLIDRFRDRITLGIHNEHDELIAFIARAAPHAQDNVPKYLNSPRTTLYHKSETLFGLAEQLGRLEHGAVPVLVEGPLDVLALDTAAPEAFVGLAPCGTALTHLQVAALTRHANQRVLVAFDADPAGKHASINAIELLQPRFTETLAAELPAGSDPADMLTLDDGGVRLGKALREPRPFDDLVVDDAIRPWKDQLDNAEAKVAALRSASRRLAATPPADIAHQAGRLAKMLDLGHQTVAAELASAVHDHAASRCQTVATIRSRVLSTGMGSSPLLNAAKLDARSFTQRL